VISFADHLRPFLPYLPSELISPRSRDDILSATECLPGALGLGPIMFECALDKRRTADFSVGVLASRGGPAALAGLEPPSSTGAAGWAPVLRFARSWADPSSVLGRAVRQLWLEFDVGLTGDGGAAVPSVFFAPPPGEGVGVALHGLKILDGGRLSQGTLATVGRCYDGCPPDAGVLFVGAMLSRDTHAVRVVASAAGPARTLELLGHWGLRGPAERPRLLTEIAQRTDDLWLAVDVEDSEVLPRVGVDCYRDRTAGSEDGPWTEFLDLLVRHGLCTEAKREALLAADRMSRPGLDHVGPPGPDHRLATLLGPAGLDRMDLSIHHVKLVDRPGTPLEAKAYLCGTYR
jgi:hypothetical protein